MMPPFGKSDKSKLISNTTISCSNILLLFTKEYLFTTLPITIVSYASSPDETLIYSPFFYTFSFFYLRQIWMIIYKELVFSLMNIYEVFVCSFSVKLQTNIIQLHSMVQYVFWCIQRALDIICKQKQLENILSLLIYGICVVDLPLNPFFCEKYQFIIRKWFADNFENDV